jgi:hypothetical protein
MKRIVWTFGLISGGLLSLMMALTIPFSHSLGEDGALLLGYTTMVLSFLLIHFGIRAYRDNIGAGSVSFGRAVAIGALITVVASLCYVATWELIYFKFQPEYATRMSTDAIEKAKHSSGTPEQVQRRVAETERMWAMYQNPLMNSAMTFIEPLPVGLFIALVSAGVLRRKRSNAAEGGLATSSAV